MPHEPTPSTETFDEEAARPARPNVSCVVPCRNEAANLTELLPLLEAVLQACASAWEVIVVDDGSSDDTQAVLAPWLAVPGFRCIELSRNFGKEAAMTAGLRAAGGDVVVVLDADLQHPPELIPGFVQHWTRGLDVVYGVRSDRSEEGFVKRLGVRAFYALVNTADRVHLPPGAGDFRLMDRKVVDALLSMPERNRFMKGLYAWVGFRTLGVRYTPEQRRHGRTNYGLLALAAMSLDGLTAFTTLPLRAVSVFGFMLAGLALGYGVYLIVDYLRFGTAVSGWPTIVVSLMLFAGIQLISLGIVGEYVGRVFNEVKARPLYLVRRVRGQGPARSRGAGGRR